MNLHLEDQVTDAQLARYADLVYRRTGIRLSPQKRMLLSNRVRRRLRHTGIASFDDYFNHLLRLRESDPEWDAFFDEITTHETYLFRDESHWEWFRNGFLAPLAADLRRGFRVWSAAASTGDEAVSMACCIADCIANYQQRPIRIVATDIAAATLDQARQGVYGERAMRLVPDSYRRRFFTKAAGAQVWQVKPEIARLIVWRQHNLMSPLRETSFDAIFVKNVLIYFDAESKAQVVRNVIALLKPHGYLLTGAAEGMHDLLRGLKTIHPWLHQAAVAGSRP